MELKKIPQLASKFWPRFFKSRVIVVVIIQLLIFVLLGIGLLSFGVVNEIWLFYLVLAVLFLVSVCLNITALVSSTRPTKHLISAIANVAGEKSNLTPPNPNNLSDKHSGLYDALQTIYELASNRFKSNPQENSQNDLLRHALDQTDVGFIAMNSDQRITYANKAAPTCTQPDASLTLDLIFNNNSISSWIKSCANNKLNANHVWTRVPNRLPGDEDRRFFDVIASYKKGSNPEIVITTVDRTSAYKDDEEDLDFVAFAAHELRGPITVIRGYLDVLTNELDSVLKDDQHELFHRLIVSTNRLSGYVNNILNTSRYDSRHLKMNLMEESVSGIYDVIRDDMQMRAKTQNRLLSVEIPDNLPTVAADRSSMSEVFGNLIDNAIKYSNEGGAINVTARIAGSFVEFLVEDHGIGMPPSVISNLFHKFYRSHRSRETVAGTGIGLYISKAIVESHGGTISVRSEDGRGSTFTVSIPIYATVADKLKASNNSNVGMISEGKGWIKNHSMYRG